MSIRVPSKRPRALIFSTASLACAGLLWSAGASALTVAEDVPAIHVRLATGPITLDGDLSDAGWADAAVIDRFYETSPGDNVEPKVRTVAYVTYDRSFLYVGVRCDDPDPSQIRAPFVDRDLVYGTDDNVALFLDTRNDRRSAVELRVNPRGIQGDAVFNDANFNEDFSPDFFYDTAARITEDGWSAEFRIPFSSLRYPKADVQTWGLIVWRNYPRDFRYAIHNRPIPRGRNCYICYAQPLTGLRDLPSSGGLVLAPYAAGQDVAHAPRAGAPLEGQPAEGDVGLDVKWSPSASMALDATVNPDFSQVEADVAQIAVNNRFALFFPEKRPFFLEGVDLFDSPLQALYTRTITAPRWGARVTGKVGASSYTALVADDEGGGSVILPGPTVSRLAPQDFRSLVGLARWRQDAGRSFLGLLFAGREIEGGGHNRVFGPDAQWRPGASDTVTGQWLYADTRTPERPELAEEWDGRRLTSHALHLSWDHATRGLQWYAQYLDVGDGFRADNGFVPQVGIREGFGNVGYNFYPEGLLRQVRPTVLARYTVDREGELVLRRVSSSLFLQGRNNLVGSFNFNFDRVRTGNTLLSRNHLYYFLQIDPSRRFTRLGVSGFVGEEIDVAGARVGRGGEVVGQATLRPTDHLTLEALSALRWLNVETDAGGDGRLFTARIQRLKATYNFSARAHLRLIGQYVTTDRDPALYAFPVPESSASFQGSALFSFRLNWQTAFYLGYGDDRLLDATDTLVRTGRQLFAKLSYAFQR